MFLVQDCTTCTFIVLLVQDYIFLSPCVSCFLVQLIEKAEAREKERLKEEARKVCVTVHMFV